MLWYGRRRDTSHNQGPLWIKTAPLHSSVNLIVIMEVIKNCIAKLLHCIKESKGILKESKGCESASGTEIPLIRLNTNDCF